MIPEPVREELRVPAASTIGGSIRAALNAYFYNSWRLVPANAIWGAVLLLTLGLLLIAPGVALVCFLVVLPLPTAGLFRLAALITRGEPVSLSDALAWRLITKRAIAMGAFVGAVSLVLIFNVLIGYASFDPLGWAFATSALWGLVIVWSVALAVWPLLFDPLRATEPASDLVRLGVAVVFTGARRYVGLMLVVAVVLIVSAALVVALLAVSVAFIALVMSNYSFRAADRIEGRRTIVVTE